MTLPAISVQGLGKRYRISHEIETAPYRTLRDSLAGLVASPWRRWRSPAAARCQEFWALKDVEFEVQPGEVVGIIGRNGAGKSTLLKILSRIIRPTTGGADIHGRVGSLLEVGTGFHPELSGRENIYMSGAILGMSRREIAANFEAIVEFAEVEAFLDTPVKRYSSGMQVRLAFAVAAHLQPEILIIDEVLAVGDAAFQHKCLGRMRDVSRSGRTVLFVSHNMGAVDALCDRGIVLSGGQVAFTGSPQDAIRQYFRELDAASAESSLAERPRIAPLRPVIQQITFHDAHGETVQSLAAGHGLSIRIAYEHDAPLVDPYFGITLENATGTPLVWLQTRLQQGRLPNLPRAGIVTCEVPELPLVPGVYFVDVGCGVGPTQLDFVERATHFEVVAADYFGTGRLPTARQAAVLVKASWDCAPTGAVRAERPRNGHLARTVRA